MRTTVVLDDRLVREARSATGIKTKRDLLHRGLEELVRKKRTEELTALFGKNLVSMTLREFLKWRRRG